jgi:TPR repeat protein
MSVIGKSVARSILTGAVLLVSLTGCVVIDDFSASKSIYAGKQLEGKGRLREANANFARAADLAKDKNVEIAARRALSDNLAKRGQGRQAGTERERLVVLGDRRSLAPLAKSLSNGNYRPNDTAALAVALEGEASKGSVTAAMALGDLLRRSKVPAGTISEQNPEFWYKMAAAKGSVTARRRLIDIAAARGDVGTIAALVANDAGGSKTATYKRLAKSFDAGSDGFARDVRRADRFWQLAGGRPAPKIAKVKAPKEPKASAKPRDEIKVAAKALRSAKSGAERRRLVAILDTAASRGDGKAAFALARYYTPKGTKPDAQALKYYAIAAANGEKRAVDEVVSGSILPNVKPGLSNSMVASLERAAAGGSADAAIGLAQMYLNGTAVQADSDKSIEWYRKAARLGSPEAQFRLGVILAQKPDQQAAAEGKDWLQRAARNGSKSAKAYLAQLPPG